MPRIVWRHPPYKEDVHPSLMKATKDLLCQEVRVIKVEEVTDVEGYVQQA